MVRCEASATFAADNAPGLYDFCAAAHRVARYCGDIAKYRRWTWRPFCPWDCCKLGTGRLSVHDTQVFQGPVKERFNGRTIRQVVVLIIAQPPHLVRQRRRGGSLRICRRIRVGPVRDPDREFESAPNEGRRNRFRGRRFGGGRRRQGSGPRLRPRERRQPGAHHQSGVESQHDR